MLFAARSATALYRLLDTLPVFAGDHRVHRWFTLVPGSDFDADALAAVERAGGRTIPWAEALLRRHDLILAASPKGDLHRLRGPRVLLPHGAGYNKALADDDGHGDSASGLDRTLLLRDGRPLAALHALAHPTQVARLAEECPPAAAVATVTGDPTFDRVLASLPLRDRYRAALRTHGRRLLVLTSTWGPRSLLRRRPDLPALLVGLLPHDTYQLALVLHPNEHCRTGELELREQLAPAVAAGLVLARPHEEWATLIVAADALITDHGSTALYAAAARDLPMLAACDGADELIPGTPMADLLARIPALGTPADAADLERALAACHPGTPSAAAAPAFAERGNALRRLGQELYPLLGLTPPAGPPEPAPLPEPAPASRTPAAFAVRATITAPDGDAGPAEVRVERRPAAADAAAHHLAAEHGLASGFQLQSAGLLYRRTVPSAVPAQGETWTADAWTTHVLATYQGLRTAAVILSAAHCLLRRTGGALLSLRIEPSHENGRLVRADPAAALSCAHAWLAHHRPPPKVPVALNCAIAGRTHLAVLAPATEREARLEA
ncbi:translation initiation factor 2 [Streptomyces sp. NPDC003006]